MPKSKKDQGLNLLKKVKKAKLDEHESAHSTIISSVPASPSLPAVVPVPIQQHTPRSDTSSYPKSSNLAQRQMEYCQFMSDFPKLLLCDRTRLKTEVENVLGFEEFKDVKIGDLNFENCVQGTPVLNSFSISSGISFK